MQLLDGVRYVVFGCGNCEEWARTGTAGGEQRGEADEKGKGGYERCGVLRGLWGN